MYLSDRKNNAERKPDDHEELELLLESFSKQVEEIVNEAENIEVESCAEILLIYYVANNPLLEQCSVYPRNCRTNPRFKP